MSIITQIVFGIIILLLVVYIVNYMIYPSSGNNDILPTMTPLNTKKEIASADVVKKVLLGSSSSTVMGFFKLENGNRTLNYQNQYIPLLQVENNWRLEVMPSSMGDQNPATRLQVRTQRGTVKQTEIIDLPPIPRQKWVFIAILRDGRRFDIIYDRQIVASHRMNDYPVVISSPLSIGYDKLDGSAIHVILNGARLSPEFAERLRSTYVDTNNVILEDNPINLTLPNVSLLAQCPSGFPCDTITQPPLNNLVQWSTPYA
jgi:hypothetical protein